VSSAPEVEFLEEKFVLLEEDDEGEEDFSGGEDFSLHRHKRFLKLTASSYVWVCMLMFALGNSFILM
jgi:hypothetical protein